MTEPQQPPTRRDRWMEEIMTWTPGNILFALACLVLVIVGIIWIVQNVSVN